MKQLLEYLAKSLTGDEDIVIEEQKQGDSKIYTILAPQEVMGILIGKEGKTIRAIRALTRARAIVDQEKVFINLQGKRVAPSGRS